MRSRLLSRKSARSGLYLFAPRPSFLNIPLVATCLSVTSSFARVEAIVRYVQRAMRCIKLGYGS